MGFLEKNLEALAKVSPATANWIKTGPAVDWVDQIQSRNGEPNILVKFGPRQAPAYGLDDPWELPRKMAKEAPRYKEDLSLVLGMGLGYIVRAILEVMEENHRIIVLEQASHLIRLALDLHDYSELLAKGHLQIAGPGEAEIAQAIFRCAAQVCTGQVYINLEPYAQGRKFEYEPLAEFAHRALTQVGSNDVTVAHKGAEIAANEIRSLPYTARARGVNELRDLYPKAPAILVSTGPSLGKNIHLLKEAQGKAVIIATGQALRSLLAYGVRPDFVASIDFGEIMRLHVAGVMANPDIPLIALCRTHYGLVKEYQGTIFVNGTPHEHPNHYLSQLWRYKGCIPSGSSVAHMNFSIAQFLGCDPIVFLGQDLALGSTDDHFNQVDHNARILTSPDGQKFLQVNDPGSPFHGNNMGQLQNQLVPGYYGGMVQTTSSLLTFLSLFERMIEQSPKIRYINATEGGAKIKGTDQMSLRQVIDEVCVRSLDKSKIKSMTGPARNADSIIDQLLVFLRQDKSYLDQLEDWIRRGLATNKGLFKLAERPEIKRDDPNGPFVRLLNLNHHTTVKAEQISANIDAIRMTVHATQTRIMRRDMNVKYDPLDLDSVKTRLVRNRTILEAARTALVEAQKIYGNSLYLMEKYVARRDAEKKTVKDWLAWTEVLEEVGDYLGVEQAIEAALTLRPNNLQAWASKTKLALTQEHYLEVENCLAHLAKTRQAGELEATLRQEYEATLAKWLDNETDLESGIFVRPLVNLGKYLSVRPDDPQPLAQKTRAEAMMAAKIQEAETFKTEVVNGVQGKEWRYKELIDESRKLGLKNDLSGAMAKLKAAHELFPEWLEARQGLATTLHHLGRYKESLDLYRELVRDYPNSPQLRFELGLLMIKTEPRLLQQGIANIVQAMRHSDQLNTFSAKLGDLYMSLYQYDKALKSYDKFLGQFKADFEAWTKRGNALFKLGRYQEAAVSFEKALALKPDYAPANEGLSRLGRSRRNEEPAVAWQ